MVAAAALSPVRHDLPVMPPRARTAGALLALALLAGCGGGDPAPAAAPPSTPAATPSSSPSSNPPAASGSPAPTTTFPPTAEGARAALEASAAGVWFDGDARSWFQPPSPGAGISDATVTAATEYARQVVSAALLEPQVWEGRTEALTGLLKPDNREAVQPFLDDGGTWGLASAFAPGTVVHGPPKVEGFFVSSLGAGPTLALEWRGSAAYAVTAAGADQPTVVSMYRRFRFDWPDDPTATPGLSWYASVGGTDECALAETGLLVPAPGVVEVPEPFLDTDYYTEQTEQEVAQQLAARQAACA